jgi:YVTN family beta-propeller protein
VISGGNSPASNAPDRGQTRREFLRCSGAAAAVLVGRRVRAQPGSFRLYVANQFADSISVVDGTTFTVLRHIATGDNPHEILVDEQGQVAYVGNRRDDTISVIDIGTDEETARIDSPGAPHGLALSADRATLFVTGGGAINVIDLAARRMVGAIAVGRTPHMLHRTPDSTHILTGNMGDDTVSVIELSTRKVVATVPVGRTPEDLAIAPDGREIVVGNQDDDSITVVDGRTFRVTGTVRLPERGAPIRLRYSPDGSSLFIASRRDGAGILRLDRATRAVTGRIPMSGLCVGMNFSPDRRLLYITDLRNGTIAQVDRATLGIVKTLSTGAGADCIEVVTTSASGSL